MGFAMLHRHRGPQVSETPEPTKAELAERVRQLENELENLRNAPTEPTDADLKRSLAAAVRRIEELETALAASYAEADMPADVKVDEPAAEDEPAPEPAKGKKAPK